MSFERFPLDENVGRSGGELNKVSVFAWSVVEDAARKSGREVSDYLDETQDAAPLEDRSHFPTDEDGAV